jgi:hypothetical protein
MEARRLDAEDEIGRMEKEITRLCILECLQLAYSGDI